MGAIFGLFFFIIILVLAFGISIISGILRLLFGFGRKSRFNGNRFEEEQEASNAASEPKHKKIFDKDDGEYVEFEEIKEDK